MVSCESVTDFFGESIEIYNCFTCLSNRTIGTNNRVSLKFYDRRFRIVYIIAIPVTPSASDLRVRIGDVICYEIAENKQLAVDDLDTYEYYSVELGGPLVDRYLAEILTFTGGYHIFSIGLNPDLIDLFELIETLMTDVRVSNRGHLMGAMMHVLGLLIYEFWQIRNSQTQKQKLVEEAILYIESHVHSPLTAELISSHLGVSYSLYRKVFKQINGMSATKFIKQKKVSKIKEYLLHSNYTIAEIAKIMGFKNVDSLKSTFKTVDKQTPHFYRINRDM